MSKASAALAHIARETPEIASTYAYDADRAAGSHLPYVVLEIAQLFNGYRTVSQVADAARISESKCERVVRKLTTLGVLVAAPRERSCVIVRAKTDSPSHDGFTHLEHDFFNSEVSPIDECDEEVLSVGERFRATLSEFMVRFRSEKAIG